MFFKAGKIEFNKAGKNLLNKLSSENQRLKLILNCVLKFDGQAKFKRLTPCGCVEAEIMQRDSLIDLLEKENGILRKQKLLGR